MTRFLAVLDWLNTDLGHAVFAITGLAAVLGLYLKARGMM